jgi:PPK2 family polyphosphate:nucleotide phosphotransferase
MGHHADVELMKRYRVTPGEKFRLAHVRAGDTGDFKDKAQAAPLLERELDRLNELQEVLYAQAKHAVLVVLQATDTGGKDGVIRNVFGHLNPQGVQVTSFKKPTPLELAHDYLWRVHAAVPAKGCIGVFNRSHYEDVLVVRVHDWVPRRRIAERYAQINDFERHLSENGVTILKFFLHISKDEQKERLEERLADRAKHWKFDPGDLAERKLWPEYMKAYQHVFDRCSMPWAPWYVIPADHKWYRNLIVARILRTTLEDLDLRYPAPAPGLKALTVGD